jgi:hypothetical protein
MCLPTHQAGHKAKRREGVEYSPSMLEPVRPGAVSPDRALCLPTFSHFLIVNKTSLSLSQSKQTTFCEPPPVRPRHHSSHQVLISLLSLTQIQNKKSQLMKLDDIKSVNKGLSSMCTNVPQAHLV